MPQKTTFGVIFIALVLTGYSAQPLSPEDHLLGYTAERASDQLELEARFAERISIEGPSQWMRRLSSRPHHVGSEHGKANAEFMQRLFESWGFDAEIERYDVLFPVPMERSLRLVKPVAFKALLEEPPLEEDPSTQFLDDALPTYNAYSADGDVTAELVYVNQGIPRDYDDLKRMGISVEGKIVIARYGGSWRGIKPKVAAEHGAIGCILYSDPRDDGYGTGDPYPKGAMRGAYGAQRGSVSDIPYMTGDPLTPFFASTDDAQRVTLEESPTLMKIPVLPISHADAMPLLEALEGPVVPEHWRGGLPITYHVGPGSAVVHLKLTFDWSIRPAFNVIAKLEGSEYPNEWIMRGNHHDAWVFGARDPISGLVSLLEEARVVGSLHKDGWRPKRTLVYAAWDAEEPGLIGSTEWVEEHEAELQEKLAVYINTDSNSRGFLYAGGSHSLESFVAQLASDVEDPQTGVSIAERSIANSRLHDSDFDKSAGLSISPLGSGSDYTPFLQHAGIASLNFGFSGESGWGAYHSVYDTYTHFERNGDPGFAYTAALAELAGRATLRLAGADVLPLKFAPLSEEIGSYLEEIKAEADELRGDTDRMNELIDDGVYGLTADPSKVSVPPEKEEQVPHLNFAPLENAVWRLERTARAYDDLFDEWPTHARDQTFAGLNAILIRLEQGFLLDDGLPRRPWFRHAIYAPGFYTGYGVKTLPGVREAVEERSWPEVEAQVAATAAALDEVAGSIQQAIDLLSDR